MTRIEQLRQWGTAGRILWTMKAGETELRVPVVPKEGRYAYGRLDLLVEPLGGVGETWVQADRLTLRLPEVDMARAAETLAGVEA